MSDLINSAEFESAIEAIDAANSADPNDCDGQPLALRQGELAHRWVERLQPGASVELRLAARAHHLRRWEVPRADYPGGRSGYLRWRRDQKDRHARELGVIIIGSGLGPGVAERASSIVAKRGLGSDPEAQVFEDAVALTFLQTQLAATAAQIANDDKMVGIIAKTLTKMSAAGRQAVSAIDLSPDLTDLVVEAALKRH